MLKENKASDTLTAARKYAARRGFAPLTGTPAQIEWAEKIRHKLAASFDSSIRSATSELRAKSARETRDWMLQHTDASWWINQRAHKPSTAKRTRFSVALAGYGAIMSSKETRRAG